MNRELFFSKEWEVWGFDLESDVVILQTPNEDETIYMDINNMLYLLGKMHLQYDDEDLDMLF